MPHHTEQDRERNDKNEQETGKPIQLDKDQKPGQQHEGQRPPEHQRPQQGGEQRPSGGTKK